MNEIQSYSFDRHRHLFSSWCASTASGASPKCRFAVKTGLNILDQSNVTSSALNTEFPKLTHKSFGDWHNTKCLLLMKVADSLGVAGFTYGVAAKMLNCYLKANFLSELEKYSFIHPPIDRLLLSSLREANFNNNKKIWRKYETKGWSNFSNEDYLNVINLIKLSLPVGVSIWKIEAFWKGHQD
ncbi:MAG: hypothetical protein V4536_01890 [Pseudomonadota bacterium]